MVYTSHIAFVPIGPRRYCLDVCSRIQDQLGKQCTMSKFLLEENGFCSRCYLWLVFLSFLSSKGFLLANERAVKPTVVGLIDLCLTT